MHFEVGQELPPYVRESGFHAWNRYAAVNEEFVMIHMEDAAGRAAGYSGAFGMGNLQWAYLHCLLREWIRGTNGRIVKVNCQFRLASEQGHTVSAKGVVTAVREENGERLVDVDIWTEIEDGTVLTPGDATVAFPM
jgi:hypothetical protein